MLTLALAALAPQLSPVPLLSTGDLLPNGEGVELIVSPNVADDGTWSILVSSLAGRQHLVVDGQVVLSQDGPLPWDPSRSVRGIFGPSNTVGGRYAYIARSTPLPSPLSAAVGNSEIAVEGTPVPAFLGLDAGTDWGYLRRTMLVRPDLLALECRLTKANSPTYDAVVLLQLDGNDVPIDGWVGVAEGAILNDGSTLSSLNLGRTRVNAAGEVIWTGRESQTGEQVVGISRVLTLGGVVLGVSHEVIARPGHPIPMPGFTWHSLGYADVNLSGHWVVYGQIQDDQTGALHEAVVTERGLVALAGSSHPALSGGVIADFGLLDPYIDEDGGVAFFASLESAAGGVGDQLWVTRDFTAAQKDFTLIGGVGVSSFEQVTESAAERSDSGRYLIVTARAPDGSGGVDAAHVLLIENPVNDVYCTSAPNSTGRNGTCSVGGSDRVNDNALRVSASSLPPQSFGYFIVSLDAGFTANAGGGQGNICLGGAIGRFAPSGLGSGAEGVLRLDVDLGAVPAPTGSFAATAGQTLRFQAWHRDANPTVTTNFTDAVAVTLR